MVLASICELAAVRSFLQARAVINFVMRAARTSEITNGDQRALRKFSASWNLSLWKHCFAPSNLAVTPSKHYNRRKARQHVKILSRLNTSQQLTANYALFSIPFAARNYFPYLLKSQVGSFSRGLKIACLYKRNISGRVTLLPGTELRPVSFNKRQQNEEAFFQKHSWCAHVAPMLKNWETLFPVSVFVSKMQIMLTLHGREF